MEEVALSASVRTGRGGSLFSANPVPRFECCLPGEIRDLRLADQVEVAVRISVDLGSRPASCQSVSGELAATAHALLLVEMTHDQDRLHVRQ